MSPGEYYSPCPRTAARYGLDIFLADSDNTVNIYHDGLGWCGEEAEKNWNELKAAALAGKRREACIVAYVAKHIMKGRTVEFA